jgi:hypothetical protein
MTQFSDLSIKGFRKSVGLIRREKKAYYPVKKEKRKVNRSWEPRRSNCSQYNAKDGLSFTF